MSEEILDLSELTSCKIICYNSFSCKDALKTKGYQYNAGQKAWCRKLDTGVLEQEIRELLKIGMNYADIQVEGASKPTITSTTVSNAVPAQGKADDVSYYILEYDYNTKYTVCTSNESVWLNEIRKKYLYLKVTKYKTLEELYLKAKELENGEVESSKEGPIRVECTTHEQLEAFVNEQ